MKNIRYTKQISDDSLGGFWIMQCDKDFWPGEGFVSYFIHLFISEGVCGGYMCAWGAFENLVLDAQQSMKKVKGGVHML